MFGRILPWICIPTNVREVRERCFSECESLRSVSFGASSTVERIGAQALSETSIDFYRFQMVLL